MKLSDIELCSMQRPRVLSPAPKPTAITKNMLSETALLTCLSPIQMLALAVVSTPPGYNLSLIVCTLGEAPTTTLSSWPKEQS